jgi:hypothetical protein
VYDFWAVLVINLYTMVWASISLRLRLDAERIKCLLELVIDFKVTLLVDSRVLFIAFVISSLLPKFLHVSGLFTLERLQQWIFGIGISSE